MTLDQAILYLELAAYIHNSDAAVKKVAKRLLKRAHPSHRHALTMVYSCKKPLAMVKKLSVGMKQLRDEQSPWHFDAYARPPLVTRLPEVSSANFAMP